MSKTPTTLIIMDGFGLREEKEGNAIANARKPFLDKVFAEFFLSRCACSRRAASYGQSPRQHSCLGRKLKTCHWQVFFTPRPSLRSIRAAHDGSALLI